MTKDELHDLADRILSHPDLSPDWEMDLVDCFAAYYGSGIMGNEECLVIFQNNLNGEIEDVQIFAEESEAEAYCLKRQHEGNNYSETEEVDEWL